MSLGENAAARRGTSTSCSKVLIRRFAAASSAACSPVVPDRFPASTSAFFIHPYNVVKWTPESFAIWASSTSGSRLRP
ncbi:hypothetical protein [Paenarthrobacter nitroguajacolicus]|uniref:hypothetical protein n=1 Tax=Paenarthrobacter nitroguajacolicus TaxID=211146 RepID=UPI00248BB52B|nr:hypothetical protein [Paenarthrobacter nitroguajacolicus]